MVAGWFDSDAAFCPACFHEGDMLASRTATEGGTRVARTRSRAIVIVGLACLAVASLGVGSASADPERAKGALFVSLDCGDGTLETVVNGVGNFTPAHNRSGTGVFVSTLFGAQSGVFTDPEGDEFPFEDTELLAKGSANPKGHEIVDCTFVVDQDFPDGSHLLVEGDVSGFWTR